MWSLRREAVAGAQEIAWQQPRRAAHSFPTLSSARASHRRVRGCPPVYKAPSHSWTAIAIKLKDVLANTVLDTIRLSTIAPNDLEVIEALKLLPLLRRQPFA